MSDTPQINGSERRQHPGRGYLIAGFFILWVASIAFALILKTLLTPVDTTVPSDPSSLIALAVFCFLLGLLGLIFFLRGLLEEEGRLTHETQRTIRNATIGLGVTLGIVFVVTGLLLSADRAFLAQFKPRVVFEPRPDYSYPAFPTPALGVPTPDYPPGGKYLIGPINSSMDKLRVGDIWIAMSRENGSILSFDITLTPTFCAVQEGGKVTTYGVDDSRQIITGPVTIQPDGSFYAGGENIALHGVLVSENELRGTLYMRYMNPANEQVCDLGTFEWSATVTDNNK